MAKEWIDGELVRKGRLPPEDEPAGNIEHTTQKPPARRPGPRNCKPYISKRLAKSLPEIADALLKQARHGKLPELKMLVQLSGLYDKDAPPPSKRFGGRSFEEILLEDWRKETGNAAATNGIADGTPFGIADGTPFGIADGTPFGIADGTPFGIADGSPFGITDEPGGSETPGEPPGEPDPFGPEPATPESSGPHQPGPEDRDRWG